MRTPAVDRLLDWASKLYADEMPALRHSVSLVDEGGAPEMGYQAKRFLNLAGRPKWCSNPPTRAEGKIHAGCTDKSGCVIEPDRWRAAAYAITDGKYRTPLLRAIEEVGNPTYRLYVKWTVANALVPSDIARLFDIPEWCEAAVLFRGLEMVRKNYREEPRVADWISGRSDAQRAAESTQAA